MAKKCSKHCWHEVLSSYECKPTKGRRGVERFWYTDRCCWCGKKRKRIEYERKVVLCGPHV